MHCMNYWDGQCINIIMSCIKCMHSFKHAMISNYNRSKYCLKIRLALLCYKLIMLYFFNKDKRKNVLKLCVIRKE